MATEALTEDQAMDAVWERLQEGDSQPVQEVVDTSPPAEAPAETPPEPVTDDRNRDELGRFAAKEEDKPAEAPEKSAEAPEKPAEAEVKVEAPGHLPKAIRERWASIDEETRKVISDTQSDYANRLREAEEWKRAAGPVYDRLVQAAKDMPALQSQTPDQIAAQVFELAQWANRLESDPVGAIMAIANHRNVADQLRARFAGGGEGQEQPTHDPMAEVRQELAAVKAELARRGDPQAVELQVAQQMELARLETEVEAFSKSKADWGILEPHIQARLPEIRAANPHLGPIEVLEHAYNTVATDLLNPLRSAAAGEAVTARKAEAAKAAASINVQPDGAGAPPPMTEDQALDAVWAKHHG